MAQKVYEHPHAIQTVDASADGVPTDADFDGTPPDGTIVIGNDATNDCIYVRVGGVWKKAALA